MAATLVDTLPQFRLNFNLAKALRVFNETQNTFAEGSLVRGAFNRSTQIGFEATLAASGVQRQEYDGRVSFVLPITLGSKEMKAMRALGNRMVEEAMRQTEDTDDWEYMPCVKAEKPWNIKVKLNRQKEFIPEINGGEVTRDTYMHFGQPGESVQIVGTFGIWMNPERGQYGIKFDAQRIDF